MKMFNLKTKTTMNMKRMALTLMACLLSGFACMAQSIVTGTNLNIGSGNSLPGTRGHAIGHNNIVESANSLAVGYGDTIVYPNSNSVALGTNVKIAGSSSFGFGQDVKLFSEYGLGIGRFLRTTGLEDCMILGSGFCSLGLTPKRFFENPYSHSLMIGFQSIHPTLTVGPSPNDYPQGDTLGKTGKVAIGNVPVPEIAAKLHIRSDYGEDAGILLEPKAPTVSNTFIRMRDEDHGIEVDGKGGMTIRSMEGQNLDYLVLQGRVGVNVANESSSYALAVNGGILTDEVFIKNVEEWFDKVLDKNYELLPLADLQRYIDQHGHLPEIPSEAEVMEEGYNMADMQGLLLKKIEELTLYTLKQQEEIDRLKRMLEGQSRK